MSSSNITCRSCGSAALKTFLALGDQPLANSFIDPSQADAVSAEVKAPLNVAVCTECWLMQITELIPPSALFSDYLYFSSFSDYMLQHAREACSFFTKRLGLNSQSFVAEIASNDGYLLKNFVRDGIPCLGIEPAKNIAEVSRNAGIDTLSEFFGLETARQLVADRGKADLIIGNNVFAHAPDTNDFVAGLAAFLKADGTVALEFPYGKEMVDKNEFDTVYHEHVFYLTLLPLVPLFARHGLEICDVQEMPIHGGSLRLWIGHQGAHLIQPAVSAMLAEEKSAGLEDAAYYLALGDRAKNIRQDLLQLLADLKSRGKTVAAYGAAAKGTTLLNYCSPPANTIDFIADRSHFKQGRLSPGLHIPIVPAEELAACQPDYCLLLAWNFADEIIAQQQAYRDAGGKYIIPIPDVRIR